MLHLTGPSFQNNTKQQVTGGLQLHVLTPPFDRFELGTTMHKHHKSQVYELSSSASYSAVQPDSSIFTTVLIHAGWNWNFSSSFLSLSLCRRAKQWEWMNAPSLSDQNNKHPAEQLLHTNRMGPSHQRSIPSKVCLSVKAPLSTVSSHLHMSSTSRQSSGCVCRSYVGGGWCCLVFFHFFLAGHKSFRIVFQSSDRFYSQKQNGTRYVRYEVQKEEARGHFQSPVRAVSSQKHMHQALRALAELHTLKQVNTRDQY